MTCGSCGHENRGERKFCASCGSALSAPCPRCKFGNLPGEKFCGGCGVTLAAPAPAGERRSVAILFADLAGYTRLSTTLDPEELHRLLTGFFDAVDGVCTRYGGRIDKHIGDNVMAIFGAPIAHGDDPERACRAAVEIHRAVADYCARVGRQLAVHVGVAYGEVIASGLGSADHVEYTVIGDAVNLAARLQDKAVGGETMISDGLYQVVQRLAIVEPGGEVPVKGLPEPVKVWKLLGVRGGRESAPASALVGRDAEVAQIEARLARVLEERRGTLIAIRGEAGIGKSALTAEVVRRAQQAGFAVHAAQTLDYGQGRGAGAIPMLIASMLGAGTDESERRRALDAAVAAGELTALDTGHLANLLELEGEPEGSGDERDRRDQQHAALAGLIGSRARPPLLVVEDVHWADAATRLRLRAALVACASRAAAVIVTTRLDGDPVDDGWRAAAGELVAFELAPLPKEAAVQMAIGLLEDRELAARCVERAAGNPLFLEQLLQAATRDAALPGTLQGIVLARIDRLPARDKAALQAASVAGQRFSLELVHHLTADRAWIPDEVIARRLVIRRRGALVFHHALIVDGIYASLTHARRRDLHRAAAAWFAGKEPALHAEHLERAGDARAAMAWCEAAESRAAVHDLDRAVVQVERGLACASAPTDRHALHALAGRLQLEIGDALAGARHWTAALADAPDEVARCRALIGIAGSHRMSSPGMGVAPLDEAQPIAERLGLEIEQAQIGYLRGSIAFLTESAATCRAHHERALAIARRCGAPEWEARALSGLGDALYADGRFEEASQAFAACVELARGLGLVGYALVNRAMLADSYVYLLRVREAEQILSDVIGAAGAARAGRAEAMSLESLALIRAFAYKYDGLDKFGARARERCRALGMHVFAMWCDIIVAEAQTWRGDHAAARATLRGIEELAASTLSSLVIIPRAGVRLLLADDDVGRIRILDEASAPMTGTVLSTVFYRRTAIEVCLHFRMWERAAVEAGFLLRDGGDSPYVQFVAARGKALAAWGRGDRSPEVRAELARLDQVARSSGLGCRFPVDE